MKLDLGSGLTPHEGFIGVDLYVGEQRVDLFAPDWPWEESSVDEIYCSHFVEHVPDWCLFMDNLWRILKPGSIATIIHPALQSVRAFQDPTHRQFIPIERWLYADQQWRKLNGLDHPPYPVCDFEIVESNWGGVHPEFASRADTTKTFAVTHYFNAAADIQVVLRARKD